MNEKTKATPTVKVKVLKEGLTFAGKQCAVDQEIEVTEPQRERLAKKGFIAATAEKPAKPAKE